MSMLFRDPLKISFWALGGSKTSNFFLQFFLIEQVKLDGELPGANVTPPHYSLEPIFLGPLEVVIWEIDG